MMNNPIRKALLERIPTFGSWLQIGPYPAVAEILANAGYDWLGVDCEHSDIDVEGFTRAGPWYAWPGNYSLCPSTRE